jgi:hypothetical protein
MSGQITGITTVNATTGIFGTLSTTNNTNVVAPALGVYGGTGDKLILWVGSASAYPYSLGINNAILWYSVPSSASHIFYVGGSSISTINNTGLSITGTLTTTGNIDCGGGIALTGSNAFISPTYIDTANLTNTYINFKNAGSGNDWCNLRQIGGNESIKLAFDFHDDINDARFCIRSSNDYTYPDTIKEVFTVDDGNFTCTGTIMGTAVNCCDSGTISTAMPRLLNVVGTTAAMRIWRNDGANSPVMEFLSGPITSATSYTKYWDMGIGGTTQTNFFYIRDRKTGGDTRLTINDSGNVGIGTTNPQGTLALGNVSGISDASLIVSKNNGTGWRNFKLGFDANFNICLGDFGGAVSGNTWASSQFSINYFNGNVGIGIADQTQKLYVNGDTTINGVLNTTNALNITSTTTDNQIVITNTSATRYTSIKFKNGTVNGYIGIGDSGLTGTSYYNNNVFIEANNSLIFQTGLQNTANVPRMIIKSNGFVGIATTDPKCHLQVNGLGSINNGSDYAVTNNTMQSGSLTIGGINANYGCGYNWSTNTAGLMMECQDNTEIMIHDSGNRLASAMAFQGGPNTNKITIGRDAGWGATTVEFGTNIRLKSGVWNESTDNQARIYFQPNGRTYFRGVGTPTTSDNAFEFMNNNYQVILGLNDNGNAFFLNQISCKLLVAPANPHDFIGIAYDSASSGNYTLYLIQYSFTGFHRSIIHDELFNINESQKFKDDYVGRIVLSTGKIATDINNGVDDWELQYDKDGLFIEDAHPIIKLCRTKKDKRVFGVLGDPKRKSSRNERLIVNSIGEGCIWVCNSNGNIENGDYITSSDYLGYGEKQDDDLLHNYTVAKATIDCDFELESPLYQCQELEGGLRISFIAATYHCG